MIADRKNDPGRKDPGKAHDTGVSVYILTYNEADKIEDALKSVTWADEILVADSNSTDGTVEIARRYTDMVLNIPFAGFGKLRNDAVAATTHNWIFSLDADERCTDEAREEILSIVAGGGSSDAYYVPRRNSFMGKKIRFCGWYPDYRQPQLFRRGALTYHDDQVHEGFTVQGKVGHMRNSIHQIPFKDLSQIISKMQNYSSLGAEKNLDAGKRTNMAEALFRGVWAFFRTYILKGGFMDGWPGFVISFYNMEYTFYKYAKLREMIRTSTR
jgi:glycosyltransferase involved in cell wall biosynthesis